MTTFNRLVATVLWLVLLAACSYLAIFPLQALQQLLELINLSIAQVETWRALDPTNFLIAQAALVVVLVAILGTLLWLEILVSQRRGVRIRTAEGGSAEVETQSIGRRLEWHLDQLAEIVTVVPSVKPRGSSVDIKLEIEAAPDVDIPLKTDEVVEVTRDVIEHDLGLKLGKLDVHMRCAPFDPNWNQL